MMSNHAFVTTRKCFNYEVVTEDLQEINERRFNGVLFIEKLDDGKGWVISIAEMGIYICCWNYINCN